MLPAVTAVPLAVRVNVPVIVLPTTVPPPASASAANGWTTPWRTFSAPVKPAPLEPSSSVPTPAFVRPAPESATPPARAKVAVLGETIAPAPPMVVRPETPTQPAPNWLATLSVDPAPSERSATATLKSLPRPSIVAAAVAGTITELARRAAFWNALPAPGAAVV